MNNRVFKIKMKLKTKKGRRKRVVESIIIGNIMLRFQRAITYIRPIKMLDAIFMITGGLNLVITQIFTSVRKYERELDF